MSVYFAQQELYNWDVLMAAITNHFVVYLDIRVTHVGVYMRVGMWESLGLLSGVHLNGSPSSFLRETLPLDLKLTVSARLAGH